MNTPTVFGTTNDSLLQFFVDLIGQHYRVISYGEREDLNRLKVITYGNTEMSSDHVIRRLKRDDITKVSAIYDDDTNATTTFIYLNSQS